MKQSSSIYIILLCGLICLNLNAQFVSPLEAPRDSSKGNLYFDFEATGFLKNNESTADRIDGFTGIGHMMQPRLSYFLQDNVQLQFGVFALQYASEERLNQVLPIFNISIKSSEKSTFTIGNIRSTSFHNLEEPLLNYDRFYQDNTEYGLQYLFNSERFVSDTWLDWQVFIEEGDSEQEVFNVGSVNNIILSKTDHSLKLPLQLLLFHRGGEIDTSDEGVQSILNMAIGLNYSYALNEHLHFGSESLYHYFNGIQLPESGANQLPVSKGYALHQKLYMQSKSLDVKFSYWYANDFFAPMGERLYFNAFDASLATSNNIHEMLTAKFIWHKKLFENMDIHIRWDAYYDMNNESLSHAASLFVRINECFLLNR